MNVLAVNNMLPKCFERMRSLNTYDDDDYDDDDASWNATIYIKKITVWNDRWLSSNYYTQGLDRAENNKLTHKHKEKIKMTNSLCLNESMLV